MPFFFFFLLSELLVWHGIWPKVQLLSTARLSYKSCESVITEVEHWNLQFLSCVMQSSASVTGIGAWYKWKKLSTELLNICWTNHGYFVWFQNLGSIGQIFWLVRRRFGIRVFRSLHIALVMASKIKFEGKECGFPKSLNRNHDIHSDLHVVFLTTQMDKEGSALLPLCIRLHRSKHICSA